MCERTYLQQKTCAQKSDMLPETKQAVLEAKLNLKRARPTANVQWKLQAFQLQSVDYYMYSSLRFQDSAIANGSESSK